MFDAYGRTVEFSLVLGIAQALREEFGADVDAHPGGPGNERERYQRLSGSRRPPSGAF